MTTTLKTWARRYFLLLLGLCAAQTVLGYGLYRVGRASGDLGAVRAQIDAATCRMDLADARVSLDLSLTTLKTSTDALSACALSRPCCTVRVVTEPSR